MATGQVICKRGVRILFGQGYGDTTYDIIGQFKIGKGTTTPVNTDTDCEDKVPLGGTEAVDACDATTGWSANGTNSITLNTTTYQEGTGALNQVKSDTSSAVFSMSKTTTSRDFTSKDLWVYWYCAASLLSNLAASNAVEIRFGSDSPNYYYWYVDDSAISSAWNWLGPFNSSNADGTTGSPVIASSDYSYFSFTTDDVTDTTSAGDAIVDDFKLASADDYLQSFLSGYPVFDEANGQVIVRGRISSTQANGISITEAGEFNNDSSPSMGTHDVFAAVPKNRASELIIEWIHAAT